MTGVLLMSLRLPATHLLANDGKLLLRRALVTGRTIDADASAPQAVLANQTRLLSRRTARKSGLTRLALRGKREMGKLCLKFLLLFKISKAILQDC